MNSDLTYADRIGILLLSLKEDQEFIISEKVRPENVELFIDIVKSYIDRSFGNMEGFYIEFSNDYKKIRKFSI